MPMSKIYFSRRGLFALWCLVFLASAPQYLTAQSVTCKANLQASLDDMCEVIIDARSVVGHTVDPLDYEITVKTQDNQMPSGVFAYTGSGMPVYALGNVGTFVKFTEPGAYTLSVKYRPSGNYCWGNFYVEDKLPPGLIDNCQCPDTATTVTPECTFSCADIDDFYQDSVVTSGLNLNPIFADNCGNTGAIFFEDQIVEDSTCGSWYILRQWKTKLYTAHSGYSERPLACKQKFKFESITQEQILAPKSKVIVNCGTDTDPESLREYFSNTTDFPDAHPDSAIACSYPYYDGLPVIDSALMTMTLHKDSTRQEMIELGPDVWALLDVIIHYEVNSSYYVTTSRQYRPVGQRGSAIEKYCKVLATYTDTDRIIPDPDCPDLYKFVRTWKMINWCTGRTWTETQIIAVMDTEAPKFAVADTIPLSSTNPWYCAGDISIPAPIDSSISDNCSDDLTWRAYVQTGTYSTIIADASNEYRLEGIQPGAYDVIYEMSDACGNIGRDTSHLEIQDLAEPVVITKDKIIVTYTQGQDSCVAKIYPYNIDVGSYDACSGDELIMEIKRLTDTLWHPFVKFSQKDIMNISDAGVPYGEHMIELRVTDESGNSSIGWSTVRVEDKNSRLVVDCGQDSVFLDCSADFPEILLDPLYAPSAQLRSCTESDLPLEYVIIDSDINPSCNVGDATVAYFLIGQPDTLCVKHFYLGDTDTLNIIYPDSVLTVSCLEENYGDVIVEGDDCNVLAKTVEEQIFDVSQTEGYCKKILRRHTIIDWCSYRPNSDDPNRGIYRFTQVIKVVDRNKPVIICEPETFSAGADCGLSNITLTASATEENACSEILTWYARLDLDGDEDFEYPLTVEFNADGDAVVQVDTLIPTGTHEIWWRAQDECGNSSEKIGTFTVTDDKAPTPQCIGGISTTVMNTDGTVAIWAKDFDLDGKSTDDCGGQIFYSFSGEDINQTSMTFTCDSISNGISEVKTIRVYVWDEVGNKDFCTVTVRLDDHSNACADIDQGMALISGAIKTESGDDLESAMVYVNKSNAASSHDEMMTDVDGVYAFRSNPMYHDYELSVSKSDDVANGLSTLDIIMIQQHILAMRELSSAYRVIAADVNADEKVSALDLVELRKVILGSADQFSSEKSWTFVDATERYAESSAPWPISEVIDINDLRQHQRGQDFVAIKLGDVNGSAVANSLIAGTRSQETVALTGPDVYFNSDELATVSLELTLDDISYGAQLSLDFDGAFVANPRINGQRLAPEQYIIDRGVVSISADHINGYASWTLQLDVITDVDAPLSEILTISESVSPEVYVSEDLEIKSIALDLLESEDFAGAEFELEQNKPNPFAGETTIGFMLPEAGFIDFSIFDMSGRQIYSVNEYRNAGPNELRVREAVLDQKGVLYYQLSAGENIATKKMVVMD